MTKLTINISKEEISQKIHEIKWGTKHRNKEEQKGALERRINFFKSYGINLVTNAKTKGEIFLLLKKTEAKREALKADINYSINWPGMILEDSGRLTCSQEKLDYQGYNWEKYTKALRRQRAIEKISSKNTIEKILEVGLKELETAREKVEAKLEAKLEKIARIKQDLQNRIAEQKEYKKTIDNQA